MPADQRERSKTTRKRTTRQPEHTVDIRGLTWLSESVVLVAGDLPEPRPRRPHAWLEGPSGRVAASASRITLNEGEADRDDTAVLILHARAPERVLPRGGSVVLETRSGKVSLEPTENGKGALSVESFTTRHLVGQDAATAERLFDRLLPLLAEEDPDRTGLAESLHELRDALRPKLDSPGIEPSALFVMAVDGIWRVDESSFYVEGWMRSRRADVTRLMAWTPEGRSLDILDTAFRYPRSDVVQFFGVPETERLGFITFVETPEPSLLSSGWLLEARLADGESLEIQMPAVSEDDAAVRATILNDLPLEAAEGGHLRPFHIKPALARLQAKHVASVEIDAIDQHGTPPTAADVSIVIPLYRRIEFLEYQLAEFVHDPEFENIDLVYVLDSPGDAQYLRRYAAHLFRLYQVPFRLAVLNRNGGFAVVNNLGSSLARGRILLLLNSDVLPAQPGWVSRLVEFYNARPQIGALAPKLLYEDNSIQHAGLYFDRPPGADVWSNEHYFKGLASDFPPANVPQEVPAVTGAALMIAKELFDELGGLSAAYIQGDYEDSDLCLRLRRLGRQVWYVPAVELYHLEGQSYPTEERAMTSEYNKWLHTFVWRGTSLLGAMNE